MASWVEPITYRSSSPIEMWVFQKDHAALAQFSRIPDCPWCLLCLKFAVWWTPRLFIDYFMAVSLSWCNPPWPLAHCLPWNGDRMRRVKLRKLVGWDTDNLIAKAKVALAAKGKQGIHLSQGRLRGVQPCPEQQGSGTCSSGLGRHTPSLWTSPLPSSSPAPRQECDAPWAGNASGQLCALPAPCAPPALGLLSSRKGLDSPSSTKTIPELQTLFPARIQTTALHQLLENANSTPAKTSTQWPKLNTINTVLVSYGM